MPHARKIAIADRTYSYVIKGGRHRLAGWSGRTIRLVVELAPGKFANHTFASKAWTDAHGNDDEHAAPHKAAFTPEDVRQVITTLEFNKGELPIPFETANWKLAS